MNEILTGATRIAIVGSLGFLPRDRRRRVERWLRGREEFRRLAQADAVLMSWGKSGRTWLRVMLSRFYQSRHGLPEGRLLEFDNMRRLCPAVPAVLFTHNNYVRDYVGDPDRKEHYRHKRIVLLVRDPRDVAVSQFFQWKYRMRRSKKFLNDYPPHGSGISLFDFVMNEQAGLPRITGFFNEWLSAAPQLEHLQVVRYEDMRARPGQELAGILEFLGTPGTPVEVAEAVEFASYDNMKKLEQRRAFRSSGARVRPGDDRNPDSFKVRRAKVGGYRDYFDDRQLAVLDEWVATRLNPCLGYGPGDRPVMAAAS
jgi:hypothetical protein